MPVIPVCPKQRNKDLEFKTRMNGTAIFYLRILRAENVGQWYKLFIMH